MMRVAAYLYRMAVRRHSYLYRIKNYETKGNATEALNVTIGIKYDGRKRDGRTLDGNF